MPINLVHIKTLSNTIKLMAIQFCDFNKSVHHVGLLVKCTQHDACSRNWEEDQYRGLFSLYVMACWKFIKHVKETEMDYSLEEIKKKDAIPWYI